MSARKSAQKDLATRRSLRPAFAAEAASSAAAPAAAAASSGSAAVAAAHAAMRPPDSARIRALRRLFGEYMRNVCSSPSLCSVLLQALPASVQKAHSLEIQRLAERALNDVQRNAIDEAEVIFTENNLADKFAEIESTERRTGGMNIVGLELSSNIAPDLAVQAMEANSVKSEIQRLTEQAELLEEENEQLKRDIVAKKAELAAASATVAKQAKFTDDVYAAVEKESRQ